MDAIFTLTTQVLNLFVQAIVVIVPLVITWFFRTHILGTNHERRLSAIIRISNAAIDFVENLDKRDELNVPDDVSSGMYKLNQAGAWMEQELQRSGIQMKKSETQEWIASEYQKRMGGVTAASKVGGLAKAAVDVIQGLESNNLIDLSTKGDRLLYMTEIGADWVVARAAEEKGIRVTREEALTWVRAEILNQFQSRIGQPAEEATEKVIDNVRDQILSLGPPEQLEELAKHAVTFAETLDREGTLKLKSSRGDENILTDVALGWLVTKASELGLDVTTSDLTATLLNAVEKRSPDK